MKCVLSKLVPTNMNQSHFLGHCVNVHKMSLFQKNNYLLCTPIQHIHLILAPLVVPSEALKILVYFQLSHVLSQIPCESANECGFNIKSTILIY